MAQQPEQPSKVVSWAYPFPLKDTSGSHAPEDYLAALAAAEDGFYPLGANGLWHGGIHFGAQTASTFAQDDGVKCVADGEVVAFRLDSKLAELAYPDGSKAGYSSGFTLVRHRLVLPPTPVQPANGNGSATHAPPPASAPAGPSPQTTPPAEDVLTFFSLYMHTLPLDGYDSAQRPGHARTLPAYYGATETYTVGTKANDPRLTALGHPDATASGLRVRASNSSRANVVGWLARDTKVEIAQKHGAWGKIARCVAGAVQSIKDGDALHAQAAHGWVYLGEMDREIKPSAVDRIYVLPKPHRIAAGETVAFIGEYQRLVEARAHHTLPVKLGERPLLHVELFTGDDLHAFIARSRNRASQLDSKSRTLLLISKGAKLVQASTADTSIASGAIVKATADSPASGPWCKVQTVNAAGHPPAGQSPLWISRADLQGTGNRPAWSRFPLSIQSAGGPAAAWERVVATGSAQRIDEAEGKTWYAVSVADENNGQVNGWVCDHGHPLVELKSPWDWPGFELLNLETSVSELFQRALFAADSGTPDELSSFEHAFNAARSDEAIRKLEEAIDGQGQRDGKITAHELQLALGKSWLADRIDHMIVRYETEWGGEMSKWDALDSHMRAGLPFWQAEKNRIDALRFWQALSPVDGRPKSATVWHVHPVGLIGNFLSSACDCAADMTKEQLKRIATHAPDARIDAYIDSLNRAFKQFNMSTCMSRVHFLAQVLHESGEFQFTRELGDSVPYDPWRGRGLIQVTGEDNYKSYGTYSGEDVTSSATAMRKLESAPHAMLSAAWYFCVLSAGLEAADDDDFIWATRLINGGFNHYDERLSYANRAIAVLGLQSCAKHNHNGIYVFRESRAYNEKRASCAWGLWNDPGLSKAGKQKNAADAKEGYLRYLELDRQAGHPLDKKGLPKDKGWYGIGKEVHVFDYVNRRLEQLNS